MAVHYVHGVVEAVEEVLEQTVGSGGVVEKSRLVTAPVPQAGADVDACALSLDGGGVRMAHQVALDEALDQTVAVGSAVDAAQQNGGYFRIGKDPERVVVASQDGIHVGAGRGP